MIAQASDYTYANVLTLKIMEMLGKNDEFKEIKRIAPSDIVNLALNVLSLIVETHDKEKDANEHDIEVYKDLIEDNGKFAYYSLLSFAVSGANNDELNEHFLKMSEGANLNDPFVQFVEGDVL